MDPVTKKQWLEALRSGKYQQTRGYLRRDNGFCCLGVLCEIVRDKVHGEWRPAEEGDDHLIFESDEETAETMPPRDVYDLVGLYENEADDLARMNDDGKSFLAIANEIEKTM